MTCWIGHKHMIFLCYGLACGPSDVLLDQMSSCKLNNCVSFLLCGWACAFSDVELYQMTNCIGHKHKLFLCCGLPCDLSELLYVRITSDILNTCASCGRAFATLSRFWRGVRSLSTVVSVKLNNLKLSLRIAETFQAFYWQLAINLLKHLLKMAQCISWQYKTATRKCPKNMGRSLLTTVLWGVKEEVNWWKH